VQVLTWCSPPIEQVASGSVAVDLARIANDAMADLVARYPDRFAGFAASLPMADADAAPAGAGAGTRYPADAMKRVYL